MATLALLLATARAQSTCPCAQIPPSQCEVIESTGPTTCTTVTKTCSGCVCVAGGALDCPLLQNQPYFQFLNPDTNQCQRLTHTIALCPGSNQGNTRTFSCSTYQQLSYQFNCDVPKRLCPLGISSATLTFTQLFNGTGKFTNTDSISRTGGLTVSVDNGETHNYFNMPTKGPLSRTFTLGPGQSTVQTAIVPFPSDTIPASAGFISAFNAALPGSNVRSTFTALDNTNAITFLFTEKQIFGGASYDYTLTCIL